MHREVKHFAEVAQLVGGRAHLSPGSMAFVSVSLPGYSASAMNLCMLGYDLVVVLRIILRLDFLFKKKLVRIKY